MRSCTAQCLLPFIHLIIDKFFIYLFIYVFIYLFIYLLGGLLKDKQVYLDDVFVI